MRRSTVRNRIWMAMSPSKFDVRVLVTDGPGDTLLKARLSCPPSHPRAVRSLMEAVALWEGRKVHGVLAVDEPYRSWSSFGLDAMGFDDTALYSLALAAKGGRRQEIVGLGSFRDLHRILRLEVAR
jgi:hypothetical protein